MDQLGLDLETSITTITDLLTNWGLKALGALAVLIVGRIVAGWVRRTIRSLLSRSKTDPTLVPFVSGLVYYLLLAVVVIAVLDMVGVQTASLIAVLGAAGLAVGLALQGTLANFAAGIMLLVFRPFQKGDYIEAAGVAGSVDAINIFTTSLNTPDNVRIVIPNASVWGQTIKNYAAHATRRLDLVVGIAYEDDIGRAIDTITGIVRADGRVLAEPQSTVAVNELGDSSVNIVVRPWCKREDYWPLRCELTRRFKEDLEKAGCSIPFPQRDVHVHQATGSVA
jgi:small conductance mechanosensitive channel